MNSSESNKKWIEHKKKLILQFPVLNNNDLIFEDGKKEQMLKELQIKLGKTSVQLRAIMDALD